MARDELESPDVGLEPIKGEPGDAERGKRAHPTKELDEGPIGSRHQGHQERCRRRQQD
jgi:hypothetical protein